MSFDINLREYQSESVEQLREGIRQGKKNQVLCSPTGSGKTVIGAYLLDECRDKKKTAIFVVERVSLIGQTSTMLDSFGIDHGVIQGNHWRTRPGERIQVATAQSLRARGWPQADLILVDECHVMMADTLERIKARDCVTIGLTATPFSKGMGKHYDGIVNVTTMDELINQSFLVPPKIYAASEPDMKGAKTVAGEWTDAEAETRSMPIIGDCVKEYMEKADGGKFIAFGVNVTHCEEMRRQFLAAGVVCELHTYRTPDEERERNMTEFRKPDSFIRGLISVSALSRGLDVPDVSCVIMCRPLKSSFAEFLQIVGRGLRTYPGKTHAVILDHSGNTLRFWDQMQDFFANGIHELDDGSEKEKGEKPKPKEKKPVKCSKCHHIHQPLPSCPNCGFVYPQKQAITHQAGDLSEMGRAPLAKKDVRQSWYSQFLGIADHKGYKPGWAAFKYKEKFGVWPRSLVDEPIEPTPEVLSYVRSRFIAFTKSKKQN